MEILSRLATTIFAWIFGAISPALVQANASTQLSVHAREVITFYMQMLSFLVAIIAGIITIYYLVDRHKKDGSDKI